MTNFPSLDLLRDSLKLNSNLYMAIHNIMNDQYKVYKLTNDSYKKMLDEKIGIINELKNEIKIEKIKADRLLAKHKRDLINKESVSARAAFRDFVRFNTKGDKRE